MSSRFSLFILSNVLFLSDSHGSPSPRLGPLVHTKVGEIRGLSADDGDYSMYMGIPFGKVNQQNPFGPSEPYPVFQEIFDAYDDSAICPQVEEFNNTFVGTLDCLHLNIYVPSSASASNRLPVMVWIYGGGFARGFGGRYIHGPQYLVKQDIILVTLNYRLGPYGFMCVGTPEHPGNQGLKDQRLALRWINENIEFFGGNADEVTIFGESAGGVSVEYHVLSDKEKLFKRAIMESGTLLLPGTVKTPDPSPVLTLAETLGFEADDISSAVAFLSTIDPKLLITTSIRPEYTVAENPFTPCFEEEFADLKIPRDRDIPVIIGCNSYEMGADKYNAENQTQAIFDKLKLHFDFNEEKLNEMAKIVSDFYLEDKELNYADFLTDYRFCYPAQSTIESFVQNGIKEVYNYVFSYVGGRNLMKRRQNSTTGGAFHTDELGYLFGISFWPEDPTPEDQLMVDRMTTMWANFAKYGNPTPSSTELLPVKWEPITVDSPIMYLNMDSELSVQTRPFNQRLTFWDLFYTTNKQFYNFNNVPIDYSH